MWDDVTHAVSLRYSYDTVWIVRFWHRIQTTFSSVQHDASLHVVPVVVHEILVQSLVLLSDDVSLDGVPTAISWHKIIITLRRRSDPCHAELFSDTDDTFLVVLCPILNIFYNSFYTIVQPPTLLDQEIIAKL